MSDMDYFSICFGVMYLAVQSVMHIAFVCRLTGKKERVWHFLVYFSLLFIMECLFHEFELNGSFCIGVWIFILYGVSRLVIKNRRSVSGIAAIFAIYISLLSTGAVNSVQQLIFPKLVGTLLLYFLLIASVAVSSVICAGCYAAVLKFLPVGEGGRVSYIELLLFPGIFFLAAELYIQRTAYSQASFLVSPAEYGEHLALLSLQVLGLLAFFCTLYAYRKVCYSFQAQVKLDSLTQAVKMQKKYISEALTRHERTKAFRHDVKNHLTVLSGLLNSGQTQKAKDYLSKMETVSAVLSFPYQTGNPAVDILLAEKLGMAEDYGIAVDVSFFLPKSCGIDDFDLCVIFANALDNAILACQLTKEEKYIRLSGERQGDFYMLGFENNCLAEPEIQEGTGLSNIRAVAEKYHGAMVTEKRGEHFSLNVLLDISCCPICD